jgi:tRNA(fMet)-specific endonuclease VapC
LSVHLDTNVVIDMLNGRRPSYRVRYEQLRRADEEVALSSIVMFELWYGIAKSDQFERNAAALRRFLESISEITAFTEQDAIAAAEIRAMLNAAGTPIGPYDLLIAAHAVRLGATLVTANTREFSRVPGLLLEDWSR